MARVGAGLAFEVGANSLLDALTLVPGSQAVGSAVINTIAQGIRGGKFSFGEVLGSAAASQSSCGCCVMQRESSNSSGVTYS